MRQRWQTMTAGRLARWLLLACTLVGLIAMHSLGHDGGAHATTHGPGEQTTAADEPPRHDAGMIKLPQHTTEAIGLSPDATGAIGLSQRTTVMVSEARRIVAMAGALDVAGDCAGDGCVHLNGLPGSGGHDMSGWSVCLAIVGGFAVMLLFAAGLLAARRCDPVGVQLTGGGIGPRAPPDPGTVGLVLATVSVLRT